MSAGQQTTNTSTKASSGARLIRSLPVSVPRRGDPVAPRPAKVTSTDVAVAIEDSFSNGPATKARILDCAEKSQADGAVMRLLHQLPNIRYRCAKDVWTHLPRPMAPHAERKDAAQQAANGSER